MSFDKVKFVAMPKYRYNIGFLYVFVPDSFNMAGCFYDLWAMVMYVNRKKSLPTYLFGITKICTKCKNKFFFIFVTVTYCYWYEGNEIKIVNFLTFVRLSQESNFLWICLWIFWVLLRKRYRFFVFPNFSFTHIQWGIHFSTIA